MKLRFDPDTGAHLRDALLSDDQTWTEYSDGSVIVQATKEDDRQLLWWILSFGGGWRCWSRGRCGTGAGGVEAGGRGVQGELRVG
jgi:hypothetical protein